MTPESALSMPRRRTLWLFVAFLLALGAMLPILYSRAVWTVDSNNVSVGSRKLPEWDYANLWAGGVLAAGGRAELLFDTPAYRAWFTENVGSDGPDREWSYPPAILALAVPLAQLPLRPSYFAWTIGSIALLWVTLRACRVAAPIALLATLGPGPLSNALFGQTGSLTAALLLGSLLLVKQRPTASGILAGLLTVKPQLGLVLPVCFAAARSWRAFTVAALVAIGLGLLVSAVGGWDLYPLYFEYTAPMMRAIMEAPFPQPYQANSITIFLSVRAAGGSIGLAYGIQALAALGCAVACWHLWKKPTSDPTLRVAATACLSLLATPYGYNYDMTVLTFAVAVLFDRAQFRARPLLLLCWLWPSLTVVASTNVFPVAPALVALTAAVCWRSLGTAGSQAAAALTSGRERSR